MLFPHTNIPLQHHISQETSSLLNVVHPSLWRLNRHSLRFHSEWHCFTDLHFKYSLWSVLSKWNEIKEHDNSVITFRKRNIKMGRLVRDVAKQEVHRLVFNSRSSEFYIFNPTLPSCFHISKSVNENLPNPRFLHLMKIWVDFTI